MVCLLNLGELLLFPDNQSILIDSLGGLVFRYLENEEKIWVKYENQFLEEIAQYKNLVVIVTEEVGWGISPPTHFGNIFRDRLGKFSEHVSKIAKDNWLVVNGNAINISKCIV